VPTLATASEGAIFANAVLEEANRLRQEQSETVKAIRDDIKAEFRAIREDAKAAQESTQAEFRAIREDAKAAQENTHAEFKAAQESTQAEFRAIREDVTNLNTTIKVIAASGGTVAVVVGLLANAGKILRRALAA
jgi:vacuolar-type H+-ATPase subunit E/Vma4